MHHSSSGPTALVDLLLQQRLLRRLHALLAEYVALPCWQDVWASANAVAPPAAEEAARDGAGPRSAVGEAAVRGAVELLGDALFDSQRQVLLAPPRAADADALADGIPAPEGDALLMRGDEVEERLRALVAPLRAFFGRAHLAALLELEGDWAVQALLEAALARFEEAQGPLTDALCALQARLPASLRSRPSPVDCRGAGELYRAYADALALEGRSADRDGGAAAAALRGLQCAGNCLALMHMANVAVGTALPARFAQAAPMLGVTAVPTAGCDTHAPAAEGGPCPGLRAPPFEEAAPGHFHAMLLGPNTRLVTESQLLVVQSCELQAWRATRGMDCIPRCLERVGVCLARLRGDLEAAAKARADKAAAAAAAAAASAATSPRRSPSPRRRALAVTLEGSPATSPRRRRAADAAPASPMAATLTPSQAAAAAAIRRVGAVSPFAAASTSPFDGDAAAEGRRLRTDLQSPQEDDGERARVQPPGDARGEQIERASSPLVGGAADELTPPDSFRRVSAAEETGAGGGAGGSVRWYTNPQAGTPGGGSVISGCSDPAAAGAAAGSEQHQQQQQDEQQQQQQPQQEGAAAEVAGAHKLPTPIRVPPISPTSASRCGVGLEASPLAEVYDETVDQLLEVLAEKDRLLGRVKQLETEMRCKDEQLQLFASTLRTPQRSLHASHEEIAAAGANDDSEVDSGDEDGAGGLQRRPSGFIAALTSKLLQGGLGDGDEEVVARDGLIGAAVDGADYGGASGSGGGADAMGRRLSSAMLPPPPLRLDDAVDEIGSGVSAIADNGADGGTPKRPNSPPRRPREATFPRLLPPAPAPMALPSVLSALRFVLLHRCSVRGGGAAEHPDLAGGEFGDGPLWAAAAMVEVLGLRRAYRRLDMVAYLAHWARFDAARTAGREAELAAEESALRRREDADAEEDGKAAKAVEAARAERAAKAQDAAAAAALVAADARAQRVWELATLAVGAPAAPIAPGAAAGAGAICFAALDMAEPLACGQDADPLACLPVCRAPMLFADAPSRFSSAADDAERRRAIALKRPAAAPAKAGLLESSRAARAVARFLEVAPPSAYSQSLREARSEVQSQIGSVRRRAAGCGETKGRRTGHP